MRQFLLLLFFGCAALSLRAQIIDDARNPRPKPHNVFFFESGFYDADLGGLHHWLMEQWFTEFSPKDVVHTALAYGKYRKNLFTGFDIDYNMGLSSNLLRSAAHFSSWAIRIPIGYRLGSPEGYSVTMIMNATLQFSRVHFGDRQPDEFYPYFDSTAIANGDNYEPDQTILNQTSLLIGPSIRLNFPQLDWNKNFGVAIEVGFYTGLATSNWRVRYLRYYPATDEEDAEYTDAGRYPDIPWVSQKGFKVSLLLGWR